MHFLRTTALLLLTTAVACSSAQEDGTDPVADTQGEELNESKALGMTDVTILYPLPKNVDFFDDMMGPTSEGDQGELLPADVFAALAPLQSPPMIAGDGTQTDPKRALFQDWIDSFPYLRVVGVRLDPCFGGTPSNLGAADCQNTIRMTLQFFTPQGNAMNVDGRSAIHLFYNVSRASFTELSKAMLALRKTTGLPLQKGLMGTTRGVHPTLFAEGLRGPYSNALKDLLLKYAGEQTLTQIAFCVQDRGAVLNGYYNGNVADSRWVFGRVSYNGGRIDPLDIATLGYTGLQTVDSFPITGKRDPLIITPQPKVSDSFTQFVNRKPGADGKIDPASIETARRASFAFLNPNKYTPKTADCASCHMAKQIQPQHPADANDYKNYTYRLDHTHDVFGPFRMFGYDSSANPIVSTRVVNETAVVLDHLNKAVMK
jgi:hypothetical protein